MISPDSATDRLAREFIARSLPKPEWTHEAHLRVGLWHVLHYPGGTALDLLRLRIRAYNVATGVANTDEGGYHETLTRFYVDTIRGFLKSCDDSRPVDALATELIARCGDRNLPLRHYSRERLFSAAARRGWLAADREPLRGA